MLENCKNIIEGMNEDHDEALHIDRVRENVQRKHNQYQMWQKTGDKKKQGRSSKKNPNPQRTTVSSV